MTELTQTIRIILRDYVITIIIERSGGKIKKADIEDVFFVAGSVVGKAIMKDSVPSDDVTLTQYEIDRVRGNVTADGKVIQTVIFSDSTVSPTAATAAPSVSPTMTFSSSTEESSAVDGPVLAIIIVVILAVLVTIVIVIVLRNKRNKAPAKTTPTGARAAQNIQYEMQSFNEEKENNYGETIVTTNPDDINGETSTDITVAEPTVTPKGKGIVRVESFC